MLMTTTKWSPELKAKALANVQWVKGNLPAIIAMGVPTPETFGDRLRAAVKKKKENNPDDLERLKEKARQAGQRVDWDKDPKAPKRPQAVTASFETKVVKATKARSASPHAGTRKAHKAYVEREDARHHPLQQRERCKSE
jgi:hypothetical protein